jgi:hypothetical protein
MIGCTIGTTGLGSYSSQRLSSKENPVARNEIRLFDERSRAIRDGLPVFIVIVLGAFPRRAVASR